PGAVAGPERPQALELDLVGQPPPGPPRPLVRPGGLRQPAAQAADVEAAEGRKDGQRAAASERHLVPDQAEREGTDRPQRRVLVTAAVAEDDLPPQPGALPGSEPADEPANRVARPLVH